MRMHLHLHMSMPMHLQFHLYLHLNVHMHMHMHMHRQILAHTCTHTYTQTYTHTHTRIHIDMHKHVYTPYRCACLVLDLGDNLEGHKERRDMSNGRQVADTLSSVAIRILLVSTGRGPSNKRVKDEGGRGTSVDNGHVALWATRGIYNPRGPPCERSEHICIHILSWLRKQEKRPGQPNPYRNTTRKNLHKLAQKLCCMHELAPSCKHTRTRNQGCMQVLDAAGWLTL